MFNLLRLRSRDDVTIDCATHNLFTAGPVRNYKWPHQSMKKTVYCVSRAHDVRLINPTKSFFFNAIIYGTREWLGVIILGELPEWVFVVSHFQHSIVPLLELIIKWRLITDAELSSNFKCKVYLSSVTINTTSVNLHAHDNSFGKLAKCC